MKKIFEGASIISAILLILTVACGFIFNIKNQKNRTKGRSNEEKKNYHIQQKKDQYYNKGLKEGEDEKKEMEEELEYHKKLLDPLWHYFDPEEDEFKVFPGKYR